MWPTLSSLVSNAFGDSTRLINRDFLVGLGVRGGLLVYSTSLWDSMSDDIRQYNISNTNLSDLILTSAVDGDAWVGFAFFFGEG